MKKCSCGKIFTAPPKDAKLDLEAILPGYYFNCSCRSTLVWQVDQHQKPVDYEDPATIQRAKEAIFGLLKRGA